MDVDISPHSTQAMSSRPASTLPARSQCKPLHCSADRNNAQLDEDWPRHMSRCSVNALDWQNLSKKLHPRVTFSESSTMHIYDPDPLYARTKSYTKEDRKSFGTDTMLEAVRIKRLVLSTPGDTADSFKYLFKNSILSLEEMVGIEQLILRKSVSKMVRERQDHTTSVLREQRRIEMMQAPKKLMMQEDHDSTRKLGDFSASISNKSSKRARIRAAMAA